jgi:hypothetical protein
MWILLLQNYRHILRTRLLAFLLAFSVLIQFMGLRLLNNVSFDFDGHMVLGSLIDKRDVIFVSLFLQLFTGTFLSAVYGIWMVPYLHRGPRSPLTFTLPVPKWMYPVSYALTMLTLLGLLHYVCELRARFWSPYFIGRLLSLEICGRLPGDRNFSLRSAYVCFCGLFADAGRGRHLFCRSFGDRRVTSCGFIVPGQFSLSKIANRSGVPGN